MTLFLASKDDTFDAFSRFVKIIQNQNSLKIISLRSDHGGECFNHHFEDFCDEFGISHIFSCSRMVERKNIVLEKLAKRMLNELGGCYYYCMPRLK